MSLKNRLKTMLEAADVLKKTLRVALCRQPSWDPPGLAVGACSPQDDLHVRRAIKVATLRWRAPSPEFGSDYSEFFLKPGQGVA